MLDALNLLARQSQISPLATPSQAAARPWLLLEGVWTDLGRWVDGATWQDIPSVLATATWNDSGVWIDASIWRD